MSSSKQTIVESLPTIIKSLRVISNDGSGKSVDLAGKGLSLFLYHESILSDSIHSSIEFIDTGSSYETPDNKNVRESLPIVGTEKVEIKLTDNNDITIGDSPKLDMYVNKVTPIGDDARKMAVRLDLVSKEFLMNDKIRLRTRFDGRISDHIDKILTEQLPDGLATEKNVDIEETQNNLNFLGNNKKSLYTLNWLAKKAVSQSNQKKGSSAGFLFYETSEGFFFKSIDGLLSQQPKRKIIFTEVPDEEGKVIRKLDYDYMALSYSKNDLINAQDKFELGAYTTRLVTFDPFNCEYNVYNPNASENEQSDGLSLGGKSLPKLNPEFDVSGDKKNFSRTTYVLLDTGSMPTGDSEEQIEKSDEENFDNRNVLNQSIMRYNQFLSYSSSITIPADFSLHAGDAITLDVPLIEVDKTNKKSNMDSGLYIITDLTHYVASDGTFTRLELVRDSIGRKRN